MKGEGIEILFSARAEFFRVIPLLCAVLMLTVWIPQLAAFEIKLFPASEVFDQDTETLHERLGLKGQSLKVEDFEDDDLEDWLRTNLKAGGEETEPSN